MYRQYNFIWMIGINMLFFIFTLILVIWLVKSQKNNNPKDALGLRLARGEIDKKEYDRISRLLRQKN